MFLRLGVFVYSSCLIDERTQSEWACSANRARTHMSASDCPKYGWGWMQMLGSIGLRIFVHSLVLMNVKDLLVNLN